MLNALKNHWPEYFMEAAELGVFMISASLFTMLLYHPDSPAVHLVPAEFPRRTLMGLAMGLTAVGIVYSPWGQQSGAHMNPAFTLTFFQLGKIAPWDAFFYILAQFAGGSLGILLVAAALPGLLTHPAVNYVATVPGAAGPWVAFAGEVMISLVLVFVVLLISNNQRFARYTGLFAGLCVAAFITFEAPVSGMSMNPARTFGSAMLPHLWNSLWIYFLAPPLGMLAGAALYQGFGRPVACAKLHHQNQRRCIFCDYHTQKQTQKHPGKAVLKGPQLL